MVNFPYKWATLAVKILITISLCAGLFWRTSQEYQRVRLRILNHMLSGLSFRELLAVETNPGQDASVLRKHKRYFAYVTKYLPTAKDAYAMRGFCEAGLNRMPDALAAYQKAASIDPPLVWEYYNLGILYLLEKDLTKAAESFKNALSVPVEVNALVLRNSKVYLDILRQVPELDVHERLKTTYALSYYWANMLSRLAQADVSLPDLDKDVVRLRIF